jgi:putative phosphoribosyl transferase
MSDHGREVAVRAFLDRHDAGLRLAARLASLTLDRPVVLGLPRGGVPVAYEVARALGAPLDVLLVRKLGVPWQRELAFGAIGEQGVRVLNDDVVASARLSEDDIDAVESRERHALDERAQSLAPVRHAVDLTGRTAVIVDDGIATGASVRAACRVARARLVARVVIAVPVAPADCLPLMRSVADDVVCVAVVRSARFFGVGQFYVDFSATTEAEVARLLAEQ